MAPPLNCCVILIGLRGERVPEAADDVITEGLSLLPHHPRPGLPGTTRLHTRTHARTHARMQAHTHAPHTHIKHTHICLSHTYHTQTRTHTHTCPSHTHDAYTHTHSHTHTCHTQTHTHTHACLTHITHTQTHTLTWFSAVNCRQSVYMLPYCRLY